ncbi:TRAP transporter permease [Chloroflexota bacterium]
MKRLNNLAGGGILKKAITVIGLSGAIYHLVSARTLLISSVDHYILHVGFVLFLALLVAGGTQKTSLRRLLVIFIMASCMAVVVYIYANSLHLEMKQPFISTLDVAIGITAIVVIITTTWIIWGPGLPIVTIAALLYYFFGHNISGPFHHTYQSVPYIVSGLGMNLQTGLFTFIPISANVIFLFLLFGGLLYSTRIIELFGEYGNAIGNKLTGGPAYSAVVGSTFVGMVTGQVLTNVILTGSLTIPLMKRFGLRPHSAAAVEVAASSGSQICPPIMGLAAFIMALFIGVAYVDIALAAVIPAGLYFVCVGIGVYAISGTLGIGKLNEKINMDIVRWITPSFVIPLGIIIILLLFRFSPGYAASYAILAVLILAFLRRKDMRPSWLELASGVTRGATIGAQMGVVIVCIGLFVESLQAPGVGIILSRYMASLIGDNFALGYILAMLIALILGMGLPTPVAYSVLAVTVVPFLQLMGVQQLAAHFFVFYFAVFSTMSPPVAVGVMAASRIADSSFLKTCWGSFRLAWVAFLLPFIFVFRPELLAFPIITWTTVAIVIMVLVATLCFAAFSYGYMGYILNWQKRLLYLAGVMGAVGYVITDHFVFLFLFLLPISLIANDAIKYFMRKKGSGKVY